VGKESSGEKKKKQKKQRKVKVRERRRRRIRGWIAARGRVKRGVTRKRKGVHSLRELERISSFFTFPGTALIVLPLISAALLNPFLSPFSFSLQLFTL